MDKIFQLLEEYDKAMSIAVLSNAKNQIRASTVYEIIKELKEHAFNDEDIMFLEHAIRAWRNQITGETDKSWLVLSSNVMTKLKSLKK